MSRVRLSVSLSPWSLYIRASMSAPALHRPQMSPVDLKRTFVLETTDKLGNKVLLFCFCLPMPPSVLLMNADGFWYLVLRSLQRMTESNGRVWRVGGSPLIPPTYRCTIGTLTVLQTDEHLCIVFTTQLGTVLSCSLLPQTSFDIRVSFDKFHEN